MKDSFHPDELRANCGPAYDPARRTGRTTTMLITSIAQFLQGNDVVVVVQSMERASILFRTTIHVLDALGVMRRRTDYSRTCVTVGLYTLRFLSEVVYASYKIGAHKDREPFEFFDHDTNIWQKRPSWQFPSWTPMPPWAHHLGGFMDADMLRKKYEYPGNFVVNPMAVPQ